MGNTAMKIVRQLDRVGHISILRDRFIYANLDIVVANGSALLGADWRRCLVQVGEVVGEAAEQATVALPADEVEAYSPLLAVDIHDGGYVVAKAAVLPSGACPLREVKADLDVSGARSFAASPVALCAVSVPIGCAIAFSRAVLLALLSWAAELWFREVAGAAAGAAAERDPPKAGCRIRYVVLLCRHV